VFLQLRSASRSRWRCADTQIEEETGASVTTKGVWVPDRTKLGPGETPLYIHITSKSMISLEKAVEKIHELINQELGPLLDERTMVARNRALGLPMPEGFGQKERTREKWPEDKLFIGLDSLRNFNIRAKVVGPGGMFVKCELRVSSVARPLES
jgi:hypothetical protein